MPGRLFLALLPADLETNSSFLNLRKKLKKGADQKNMDFKWAPLSLLHITLWFFGEQSEQERARLCELMPEWSSKQAPIELEIRGLGAFPDIKEARILWLGVQRSRELLEMHKDLTGFLVGQGWCADEKEFIPHMTLGRLRNARSVSDLISPFVRTRMGDFTFSQIHLLESHLQNYHPVYKSLGSWPLLAASKS